MIGSLGISAFTGGTEGAPEMTTRGGAGDVLSAKGERRGVVGPSLAPVLLLVPCRKGGCEEPRGEVRAGEEGPGEEVFMLLTEEVLSLIHI